MDVDKGKEIWIIATNTGGDVKSTASQSGELSVGDRFSYLAEVASEIFATAIVSALTELLCRVAC